MNIFCKNSGKGDEAAEEPPPLPLVFMQSPRAIEAPGSLMNLRGVFFQGGGRNRKISFNIGVNVNVRF